MPTFTPTLSLSLSLLHSTRRLHAHPSTLEDATQNYHFPQRTDKSHSRGEDNFGVCIFSHPNPPNLRRRSALPGGAHLGGEVLLIYLCILFSLLRAHELQVENAIPGVSPKGSETPCTRLARACTPGAPLRTRPQIPNPKLSLTLSLNRFSVPARASRFAPPLAPEALARGPRRDLPGVPSPPAADRSRQ